MTNRIHFVGVEQVVSENRARAPEVGQFRSGEYFFERFPSGACDPIMAKNSNQWPETNASLILRVKDPLDDTAWSAFLAIYRPVVYRMARGRGMQHADAEDLTQQVFVSIAGAIENWEGGEDRPPFRFWLHRIARNAIVNAITRRKPDQGAGSTSVREMLDAMPSNDDVSRELEQESRSEALRWAAEQIRAEFSDATWKMFWQTAIAGKPVAEIAKDVGRSTGAVYMARYRIMQRLKAKISEVTDLWGEE